MPQALDGLLRKGFYSVNSYELISLDHRMAEAEAATDSAIQGADGTGISAAAEPVEEENACSHANDPAVVVHAAIGA